MSMDESIVDNLSSRSSALLLVGCDVMFDISYVGLLILLMVIGHVFMLCFDITVFL